MKTLTKRDLADALSLALNLTDVDAVDEANQLIEIVKNAIFNRETVYIPKRFKIVTSIKSPRPGRNPKTGVECTIKQRHSVRISNYTSDFGKFNKTQFIEDLMDMDYTEKVARTLVETLYNFLSSAMDGTHRIEIRGLGVFSSVARARRLGRNPKTGDPIQIEPHRKPTFKISSSLRRAMDKEYLWNS